MKDDSFRVFLLWVIEERLVYMMCLLICLLGLRIGIIFAVFQAEGIVFSAMLHMSVSVLSARGPKCFRCLMFMLSGPVQLLLLSSL